MALQERNFFIPAYDREAVKTATFWKEAPAHARVALCKYADAHTDGDIAEALRCLQEATAEQEKETSEGIPAVDEIEDSVFEYTEQACKDDIDHENDILILDTWLDD